MRFGRKILQACGAFALASGFSWPAVAAGDAIIFSKPAVEIVAPPRDEKAPEPRTPIFDFSAPNPQPSIMVPPPDAIVRVPGRQEIPDDRHPLLRTPRIFADPDEEKKRKEAMENPVSAASSAARSSSPFVGDRLNPERQDRQDLSHALSPVKEFNSEGRDVFGHRNGLNGERSSPWETSSETDRRNRDQLQSPFRSRDEYTGRFDPRLDSRAEFGSDPGRPGTFADAFGGRVKEKPTQAQIERRAEFEQLLNPNSALSTHAPNSLEPVVNAADARPANLAIPTVGGTKISPGMDPMTAFNQQHEQLRGPVLEDVNKKFNNPKASASPYGANSQTPQKLAPLTREFPTRKF